MDSYDFCFWCSFWLPYRNLEQYLLLVFKCWMCMGNWKAIIGYTIAISESLARSFCQVSIRAANQSCVPSSSLLQYYSGQRKDLVLISREWRRFKPPRRDGANISTRKQKFYRSSLQNLCCVPCLLFVTKEGH